MQRALMNTTYLQSKISELHQLHNRTVTEYGDLVASLNREVDIFVEIIPSYRISTKEEDGEVRKKKEVYQVERLEREMLSQYEHFLQLLRKLQRKQHPEQQALGSRLCAKLVGTATEFNHADQLLSLAVTYANSKSVRVSQPCMKALSELMDGQMIGETTEHVVAAILNIVRQEQYAMNPKILNALLHIRVAMIDMHRRDLTEEKAKNKKMKKEDKELARQMQKAKARQDRSEIAAKQTRILHRMFVIYLRVIQSSKTCSKTHQTKLLAPALEGLVKFAPLVNVDLHQQLMTALKELLDEDDTSVTTKLHALIAVSCLAQKDATAEGSEWRVDLSHFHEILYRCIPEALTAPSYETEKKPLNPEDEDGSGDVDDAASAGSTSSAGSLSSTAFSIAASMANGKYVQAHAAKEWTYRVGLVLRTVDLLFLTQKHIPLVRVNAFLRRLMQWTVLVPPHIAMSLLSLCHRLALRYPATNSILLGGSDNVLTGKGVYRPDSNEMARSNAECSFAWELSFHQRSYHPTLRSVGLAFANHYHRVSKLSLGQPPVISKQLNALGPYEVLETYNPALGDIKPDPPVPGALKKSAAAKRAREEEAQAGKDDVEKDDDKAQGGSDDDDDEQEVKKVDPTGNPKPRWGNKKGGFQGNKNNKGKK